MSTTRGGHPVVSGALRTHGALSLLRVMGLSWLASGCGQGTPASSGEALVSEHSSLSTDNGLSSNGLSSNGLSSNGLSSNGLTTLALSTPQFETWFDSNAPAYSNMVMTYVVACAYPAGSSLSYQAGSGTTYTWSGRVGLTPDWASGNPISSREQQLLTACLAAHVNKFGLHVTISLQGWNALGTALPLDVDEATTYSEPEAAFFGDLLSGNIFVCNDRVGTTPAESSARGCGISSQASGMSVECPPLVHVGKCAPVCKVDKSTGAYASCTYGGETYLPLTTKIRPADVYHCGDGVCQVSESCDSSKNGNGRSYNSCASDCGICP